MKPAPAAAVLLLLLLCLTGGAQGLLRCHCTTDKGGASCHYNTCVEPPNETPQLIAEKGAFACATVNVTGKGVYYACIRSKAIHGRDTICKQAKGVTACWCRNNDYCNLNLLQNTLLEDAQDKQPEPQPTPPPYRPPPTRAPVTWPPATRAPVTWPPATRAPVTWPPATRAPVTWPPATRAPVTWPPATRAPVTWRPPPTRAPVTYPPVTRAPVTYPPVTWRPPPTRPPLRWTPPPTRPPTTTTTSTTTTTTTTTTTSTTTTQRPTTTSTRAPAVTRYISRYRPDPVEGYDRTTPRPYWQRAQTVTPDPYYSNSPNTRSYTRGYDGPKSATHLFIGVDKATTTPSYVRPVPQKTTSRHKLYSAAPVTPAPNYSYKWQPQPNGTTTTKWQSPATTTPTTTTTTAVALPDDTEDEETPSWRTTSTPVGNRYWTKSSSSAVERRQQQQQQQQALFTPLNPQVSITTLRTTSSDTMTSPTTTTRSPTTTTTPSTTTTTTTTQRTTPTVKWTRWQVMTTTPEPSTPQPWWLSQRFASEARPQSTRASSLRTTARPTEAGGQDYTKRDQPEISVVPDIATLSTEDTRSRVPPTKAAPTRGASAAVTLWLAVCSLLLLRH